MKPAYNGKARDRLKQISFNTCARNKDALNYGSFPPKRRFPSIQVPFKTGFTVIIFTSFLPYQGEKNDFRSWEVELVYIACKGNSHWPYQKSDFKLSTQRPLLTEVLHPNKCAYFSENLTLRPFKQNSVTNSIILYDTQCLNDLSTYNYITA